MITQFSYSPALVQRHPLLHAFIGFVEGVTANADCGTTVGANLAIAKDRLTSAGSESRLESVQQWRIAYRQSGTDPTRFRMAAESILRRLRTSNEFTMDLHPLVVLCNSFSARYAMPVAALDASRIDGHLSVRPASGHTVYRAFDQTSAVVPAGEVTFEDEAGHAHARRWSHKQSALSAVSSETNLAFVIAEALHSQARVDLEGFSAEFQRAIALHWPSARCSGRILGGADLVSAAACPHQAPAPSVGAT